MGRKFVLKTKFVLKKCSFKKSKYFEWFTLCYIHFLTFLTVVFLWWTPPHAPTPPTKASDWETFTHEADFEICLENVSAGGHDCVRGSVGPARPARGGVCKAVPWLRSSRFTAKNLVHAVCVVALATGGPVWCQPPWPHVNCDQTFCMVPSDSLWPVT